jgi:type I restriction enzyme, R subunit
MGDLDETGLWDVQSKAITNLETSLADNRPRALIQMATGSGKTYTAASASYRLIKFSKAKRILFLVDRNNLGRQTLNEFQQYVSPYTNYKFTEEYNVQHLKRNTVDPAAKVCITTIQRLYSMLKGEADFEEDNEEGSLFETAPSLAKEPLPVVYNPDIPIETFDVIIVDECHRSIYNLWRQTLEYFDAFMIGLTATPTAQTIGFFNRNLVMEYTHEDAVADGVNVGYDVYRIETEITKGGAKLKKEPELFVPHRDRRTKSKQYRELDDDVTYTGTQLDRDVVSDDQQRLVIQTFRKKLFTEIFPGRKTVPKTLVFAKTDLHAEDLVRVIREEFGQGNDFCQKITSKTTGRKPEELLNEFRNSFHPRIAVTVDMIATGTDVKPLECLLFMRNIRSWGYFEQMKGRGCRVIDTDTLQSVTPDAKHKTHFVIVDAVGVCESDKSCSKPLDRKPSVSLEKVLNTVATGVADADLVSTLASRLTRLSQRLSQDDRQQIAGDAGGASPELLAHQLLDSINNDAIHDEAVAKFNVPTDQEPTDEQKAEVEQERMREALKPFHNPKLRNRILAVQSSLEQVIDEVSRDKLLRAGFDAAALEKARSMLTSFRQFIEDNRDEIEALQILYSRPHRAGLRYGQVKELMQAIRQPPLSTDPERLWLAYEAVEPDKVQAHGGKQLVDLIALVRHALDPDNPLTPVSMTVEERYQQWLAEQQAGGAEFTAEQRQWLDAIKDHIASSLTIESDDFDDVPFNQFGGLGRAYELFGDSLNSMLNELNARLAA